jgi:hypothetical protein
MRRRTPRSSDFPPEPDDDRSELSILLEETVESLAAAVAGWRTEIARTAERTARLEDAVDSLTGAMESLKTQVVRAEENADDKLERVTDIVESGLVESRTTADDIRELLGSSAASLVRAMEDWKGELGYGVGLSEVKLLSAVEKMEGEVRLLKGSLEERNNAIAESTGATEARLAKALERTVEILADSLGKAKNEIEASITSLSGTLVASHESLAENVSKLGTSVSQVFRDNRTSDADSERKLLLSLEALESGIDVSLTARQEFENRILTRLEGLEARLSRAEEESGDRQERLESSLGALATNTEAWQNETREIANRAGRHPLEDKILMRLDEVDIRLAQAQRENSDRQERLAGAMASLSDSLEAWWAHAPDLPPDLVALQGFGRNLVRRFEDLESKLLSGQVQADLRNQRLENFMIDLANNFSQLRTRAGDGGARVDRIVEAGRALDAPIVSAEGHRWSPRELSGMLKAFAEGLAWLRSNANQYDTLMRGLEELDLGVLRSRDDLAKLAEGLEARIAGLEQRVDRSLASAMERLERSIAERNQALASAILRAKGSSAQPPDAGPEPPYGDLTSPSYRPTAGPTPPRKGTRRR